MFKGSSASSSAAPAGLNSGWELEEGSIRPQTAPAATVPHTLQVRRSMLEKNREKMPGSWVTMSWTATRSRYRQLPQFSQYQEKPSSSSGPRRRSTTMPTLPAGRCGECATSDGSRKISPARMGTSIIRPD